MSPTDTIAQTYVRAETTVKWNFPVRLVRKHQTINEIKELSTHALRADVEVLGSDNFENPIARSGYTNLTRITI